MLENTHVVTNTVLKEDYTKWAAIFFKCRKMIVSVCLSVCAYVDGCDLCVHVCVCACACVCMRLHIHTSEFKCPIPCQGIVHSTDILAQRFDTKHRLINI